MHGPYDASLLISTKTPYTARRFRLKPVFSLAALLLLFVAASSPVANAVEVPAVKADLGPCTADFTVTDSSDKPLYNAKIQVTIRYGFLSKRKLDLEIGTNSDGRARFEGLPNKVKRPLNFHVRFGDQSKSVWHDPADNCSASFNVALESE